MTWVQVDRDRCVGMGICESLMPEHFEVRGDGAMVVVQPAVAPGSLQSAHEVVASCPTGALSLVEHPPDPDAQVGAS